MYHLYTVIFSNGLSLLVCAESELSAFKEATGKFPDLQPSRAVKHIRIQADETRTQFNVED